MRVESPAAELGRYKATLLSDSPTVTRRALVATFLCLSASAALIASFLDEKAIDEFVISVAPVFIGDGLPLIARRHRHVPLDLHSTERFEDRVVQLHYRVLNQPR